MSETDPSTLIVYGLVSNPATVADEVNRQASKPRHGLTNRYAVVSPGTPDLRLSTAGWLDLSVSQSLEVKSAQDLKRICREALIHRSSPFSGLIRSFLEQYLDFIDTQLETHRNELEPGGGADEIYDYRDWFYSAWLPLPQAQILLPAEFDPGTPSFAEFDIVFWLSGELIGVSVGGSETVLKSKQRKLDYLAEHLPQLKLIRIPRDVLKQPDFPVGYFPESLGRFWQDLALPMGLCPPTVI